MAPRGPRDVFFRLKRDDKDIFLSVTDFRDTALPHARWLIKEAFLPFDVFFQTLRPQGRQYLQEHLTTLPVVRRVIVTSTRDDYFVYSFVAINPLLKGLSLSCALKTANCDLVRANNIPTRAMATTLRSLASATRLTATRVYTVTSLPVKFP
jgi:hypothetical protein